MLLPCLLSPAVARFCSRLLVDIPLKKFNLSRIKKKGASGRTF